jgi:hypothetical protein
LQFPNDAAEKTPRLNEVPNRRTNLIPKVQDEQEVYLNKLNTVSSTSENNIGFKPPLLQPPPHSLPIIPGEKVIVNPAATTKTERQAMTSSVKMYTVASLQQYTNSFSQENLIGEGTLGSVYRAELPDGKVAFFQFICNILLYDF